MYIYWILILHYSNLKNDIPIVRYNIYHYFSITKHDETCIDTCRKYCNYKKYLNIHVCLCHMHELLYNSYHLRVVMIDIFSRISFVSKHVMLQISQYICTYITYAVTRTVTDLTFVDICIVTDITCVDI